MDTIIQDPTNIRESGFAAARNPGYDPVGAGRLAHRTSPWEITTRLVQEAVHLRPSSHRQGPSRAERPGGSGPS